MQMTLEQFRQALRDGTVVFCLPAAHAEYSSEFLDEFSERILKQDWRDVMEHAHCRVPSLMYADESEDDLVAAIEANYGADVSDLPGLPMWEVIRRCAGSSKS
jgi:hypothetical protein